MTTACVLGHLRDPDRPRPAADGLLVCAGHRARTWRHLAQLGPLHAVLGELTAAGAGGPKVSGSPGQPIPYSDRAGNARRWIRQHLAGWVREVADARGLARPADALDRANITRRSVDRDLRAVLALPRPHTAAQAAQEDRHRAQLRRADRIIADLEQATDVEHIVAWLAVHHDWLLAQPRLDDYVTDLADLHSTAWAIAYPTRRSHVPIAPCRHPVACDVATRAELLCPGTLHVTLTDLDLTGQDDLLPEHARCDTCTRLLPARDWIRLARADAMLTAVQLSATWGVPVGTVQVWAHRDGWRRDSGYPTRYDAAQAQDSYDRRAAGRERIGA